MEENGSGINILQETITKESLEKSQVHFNLGEGFIVTTEDKVKLCLIGHLKNLEKKNSWATPLALLISIILTFLTADFKDWIFSKHTWQAVFLILGVVFLFWLIYGICTFFKAKTIGDIVEEIKKSSKSNQ